MYQFLLGRSLEQFLAEGLTIVGIALISVGVALAFLARRITRAVRNNNNVSSNDKLFLTLKISALIITVVGFLLIALEVILYVANR